MVGRSRWHQSLLLATFLPLCWLGMMAAHEFGHVLGLWCTGGTVARVVLHPLTISRTDPGTNPRPLAVTWAGPAVGVFLPLAAFGAARAARLAGAYLLRFFAGFCLVANGAYLGVGSRDRVGDAGDLLRHGAPAWHLWLFGAGAVPLRRLLWHKQGAHFGLGERGGRLHAGAAYLSLALLAAVVAAELWWGGE